MQEASLVAQDEQQPPLCAQPLSRASSRDSAVLDEHTAEAADILATGDIAIAAGLVIEGSSYDEGDAAAGEDPSRQEHHVLSPTAAVLAS